MVGAEDFLQDRQVAFVERLRLAVAALNLVQHRQVVKQYRDIQMVGAEGVLPDRQGALVERLCLSVAALIMVQHRQVVDVGGDAEMIGARFSFAEFENFAVEWNGLLVLAGVFECLALAIGLH